MHITMGANLPGLYLRCTYKYKSNNKLKIKFAETETAGASTKAKAEERAKKTSICVLDTSCYW